MTHEERLAAHARIVERTQKFSDLAANPEFQAWHRESVMASLESIRDAAMGVDRSQPGWRDLACDLIASYQETDRILRALFFKGVMDNQQARKAVRELETSGD